ncbi:MAG: DegV family protein [Chloroflexi bacterium]|nr:DegV family protein [Chloroflexota bacterium]
MSKKIALITDSTSNLDLDLAAERHIYVAPLYVLWGDEMYRDDVELTRPDFFERLEHSPDIPKTAQVAPQDFVDLFHRAREAESADEIVCGVISSDLSGTYDSALQAREQVDFPVHIVDTRQASWALGFPMLAAADARDAGAGPEAVAQTIAATATRSRIMFTIDSLEYLRRGGRIGNARLLLGSALSIKPVLELREGIVESVDNVRTRRRALQHMITRACDMVAGHCVERLGIIHSAVEDEGRAFIQDATEQLQPQQTFLSYTATTLGVHTGPHALGLIVQWGA